MIVVHHLNNSRSQRVLWLLEELGVEYEVKRYQRDAKTMLAPPELRQVHPLGKSPVISDGDLTLAESGAIVEYLADKYGAGRLAPAPGTPERLRYTYWMHFAEGSAMPPLLMKLVFDRIEKAPAPFFVRPHRARDRWTGKELVRPAEHRPPPRLYGSELAKTEWFAGNAFSAADVQMSFPLEASAARGGLDSSRPRLTAFLERIHARPAYARALEKGGPVRADSIACRSRSISPPTSGESSKPQGLDASLMVRAGLACGRPCSAAGIGARQRRASCSPVRATTAAMHTKSRRTSSRNTSASAS
jgi:glutathione S-transferase